MEKLVYLLLLMNVVYVEAQTDSSDFFKPHDFNHYFFADHYAPSNRLGLGMVSGGYEYDIAKEPRRVIPLSEPVLGVQFPIYYKYTDHSRFAVSVPVSFSVCFDFTEYRTAPIVNTDYRFALVELNYSRTLNHPLIHNIGVRFIPYFHESTHLGDELMLARAYVNIPTARINVSYETVELGLMINDSYGEVKTNHKLGIKAKILWDQKKGYYSVDSLEVEDVNAISSTKNNYEIDFNYQYQSPDCFFSNHRMMFTFSQWFQLASKFGYPYYYRDRENHILHNNTSEQMQLNSNTLVGWQLLDKQRKKTGLGIFFRVYLGRNYHGQFRNLSCYPWTGISIIFDPSTKNE